MRWALWHRTTYTYDDEVTDSLGVLHLRPRSLPYQRVLDHELSLTPVPGDAAPDVDHFGNETTFFQVRTPHTELVVRADSTVEVEDRVHDDAVLAVPWERARPAERRDLPDAWRAIELALPSPRVSRHAGAASYAAASLAPGRPLGEASYDLMHRIHEDFAYDKTATTVTSTLDDVLAERAGVCQDFAHLFLAGWRAHGLAARYVSGYLATTPPPGKERVVGADASHAWVEVWLPGSEGGGDWLALDPTNDQPAGERYVTVACGRDYGDVPPVRGIIFTEARSSSLKVEVDVAPG
ncbi:hypothetical protein GCM10011519_19970 [Marmoricola endophyticus]|uniref:Transglutaminase-like domain-containing protein n=1 Tax=Marmoricola endophyticus TaxID=2040280 RepID=A0A917F341_9ACTN|nr:transglutaminase family protein [Marmoricola endophyticus]GGF46087.1 hypothetical protein GCM10011519_19970 [Marmoricola endophyticus]